MIGSEAIAPRPGWVAALRSFIAERERVTVCELCGAPAGSEHPHLADVQNGTVLCSCCACALLFGDGQAARYRRIPDTGVKLAARLTDAEWNALDVPVDVAFFWTSTKEGGVLACYPGPAGVIHAFPPPEAWGRIVAGHPELGALQPDVEALLVDRTHGRRRCYRAPIDQCYALAGLLRQSWRGLDGGGDAWQRLDEFFAALERGTPAGSTHG